MLRLRLRSAYGFFTPNKIRTNLDIRSRLGSAYRGISCYCSVIETLAGRLELLAFSPVTSYALVRNVTIVRLRSAKSAYSLLTGKTRRFEIPLTECLVFP